MATLPKPRGSGPAPGTGKGDTDCRVLHPEVDRRPSQGQNHGRYEQPPCSCRLLESYAASPREASCCANAHSILPQKLSGRPGVRGSRRRTAGGRRARWVYDRERGSLGPPQPANNRQGRPARSAAWAMRRSAVAISSTRPAIAAPRWRASKVVRPRSGWPPSSDSAVR